MIIFFQNTGSTGLIYCTFHMSTVCKHICMLLDGLDALKWANSMKHKNLKLAGDQTSKHLNLDHFFCLLSFLF